MSVRSADATIKGYYYQFNKTIESIFSLQQEEELITIEGIEDIDVNTVDGINAVQCKYYSSVALTHSAIREPITLMLDHFIGQPSVVNKYSLYGFFKNETPGLTKRLNLQEIKSVLTYKEKKIERKHYEENKISDIVLESFITKLFIYTGKDFEDHKNDLIVLIKSYFQCDFFDAENYYYNNAIKVVFDLAIKKSDSERTIRKKDFIKRINCSEILFFSWFKRYRGSNEYLALLKKQIKNINILSPSKNKLIFIGRDIDLNSPKVTLVDFVEILIEKFYKIGMAKYNHLPVTLIVDLDRFTLLEMKRQMIRRGIIFNDGYEEILFNAEAFCAKPIINRSNSGRIIKSSFSIRIISEETFCKHQTDFVEDFYVLSLSDKFHYPNFRYNKLIEVKYVNSLNELSSIIA